MKEKNISYGWIIFIGIIIILFIPIISDYIKKQNIEVLSVSDIKEKIGDNESFLVYIGDLEKDVTEELRNMRDMTRQDYSLEYNVYSSKNSDDIRDIFGEKVVIALVVEGDIQKTYTSYEKASVLSDVQAYFLGDINDEIKSYKVVDNFSAFKKLVKSDDVIVSIFGRESCFYCNKFKLVYNAVAEKYNLDIYYFDSDSYNSSEYSKIINMDLVIPAKCNAQGKEFKLADGFGTPLTIFTKKGKVVDCISGYVNRKSLVGTLEINKVISE